MNLGTERTSTSDSESVEEPCIIRFVSIKTFKTLKEVVRCLVDCLSNRSTRGHRHISATVSFGLVFFDLCTLYSGERAKFCRLGNLTVVVMK